MGLYRSSRLTVCAARLEPFGLTVLESTSCGTPVVAVAQGGYRETVVDGVNGYFAERNAASLGEGIIRIMRGELNSTPEALHASEPPMELERGSGEDRPATYASPPRGRGPSRHRHSGQKEPDCVMTNRCRSCGSPLGQTIFDLGLVPLANAYPATEEQCENERRYPLKICLCEQCWLLQLEESIPPSELFSDYAYFSSYSDSWMNHARRFAEEFRDRWRLDQESLVVEVASNDGYLLRHFVDLGIPVLGIDPAENIVPTALAAGVPTEVGFFGLELAEDLVDKGLAANLVVANNVFAHVPDTNDFAAGLERVLAPEGILSVDFPELSTMLLGAQFDQIYHEHVFYFSLLSIEPVLRRNGLKVIADRAAGDPWGEPPGSGVPRVSETPGERIRQHEAKE